MVVATEPTLVTLDDAAAKYGIPRTTLENWVRVGHLEEQGRERFPARGGGKILVDEREVAFLAHNRPKTGRPRKQVGAY